MRKWSIVFLFFAANALAGNSPTLSPYIPHIYLNGYAGGGDEIGNFYGRADLLAPVFTDPTKDLFIYGQAFGGDEFDSGVSNPWSATAGAGYRQIFGDRIYGVYLLSDYINTVGGNNFWTISPGIETLGEIIDFRANGYFPLGDKHGDSFNPVFYAHDTNHDLYQLTDETIGPGGDAEVGAKIFSINHMPVKAFLDGYYFAPEDEDNILGIGGRLTFQPTRYLTLEARYTYDNVNHNAIVGGIRLYLNGFDYGVTNNHVDDMGIQPRLYDQIERNFEAAGVGITAMTEDSKFLQQSDYFTVYVKNGETPAAGAAPIAGDGTLQNPHIYTDPTNMQTILDNTEAQYGATPTRIYFTAPNGQPFNMTPNPTAVDVHSNQMLWGTTGDDFALATNPNTYAVEMVGGFELLDVNGVQFHNLQLNNYPTGSGDDFVTAIFMTNAQNTMLQSVEIGNPSNPDSMYNTALLMENSGTTTFDNSNIFANSIGIQIANNVGDLLFINNTLVDAFGVGISSTPLTPGEKINIGNLIGDGTSQITGQIEGLKLFTTGSIVVGNVYGLTFSGDTAFIVEGSDIQLGNIINSNFNGLTQGFLTATFSDGQIIMGDIINSNFSVNSNNTLITAFGAVSSNALTIGNILNSTFSANTTAAGGNALAFRASSAALSSEVTIGKIEHSTFTASAVTSAVGFTSTGLDVVTIGSIIDSSFTAAGTLSSAAFSDISETLNIGNIIDSDFNGSFVAQGIFQTSIGNIICSTFVGDQAGFLAVAQTGGTLSIGNIYNSQFIANKTIDDSIGFVALAQNMTIGKVESSSFTGQDGMLLQGSIAFPGGTITINNQNVTNESDALNALGDTNTFDVVIQKVLVELGVI